MEKDLKITSSNSEILSADLDTNDSDALVGRINAMKITINGRIILGAGATRAIRKKGTIARIFDVGRRIENMLFMEKRTFTLELTEHLSNEQLGLLIREMLDHMNDSIKKWKANELNRTL
jgi:hypothetical protein